MQRCVKVGLGIIVVLLVLGIIGTLFGGDGNGAGEVAPQEPPPPATPTPEPLEVSGTGSSVLSATLNDGKYVVSISVTNNAGSYGATNFVVKFGDDLVVNEIAESWSGTSTIDVGGFRIPENRFPIEVDASPRAQWTIEIQRF